MPDLTSQMERELAELEAALGPAVRETRPAPSPEWGQRMDTLVERGFQSWSPPRRATSGRRWWSPLLGGPGFGLAAAALLVALVVALPKGTDDQDSGATGAATQAMSEAAPEDPTSSADADLGARQSAEAAAGVGGDEAVQSTAEPLGGGTVAPAPAPGSPGIDGRANRKVERSASLTLATRPRNIDAVSARVQEVTRAQGGFVVSSSVSSSQAGGGGTFELRVPARNLDATMAALSRLGAVRDRAQRSQDITAETVSARERLTDAETERRSLLRQLGAAETVTETEAIRARLRFVSREIASAEAGVRRVGNRAAFSTVAVTLVADAAAAPAGEEDDGVWSPGDAADDAVRVLEVVAGVALVALAVLAPLAVLALLALVASRWATRRRRERTLEAV